MSGITGFVNKKIIDKKSVINDMLKVISHRGTCEDDIYINDSVAIGYKKMAINSLDVNNKIIYNEKRDKLIELDGEIYNYQFLYEDLVVKGHKFKTNTHAELILHGYEEYGKDILGMLRGMFAFIIYDINDDSFFGTRDFYGIKPMYYYMDNKNFMFSSELKAFLVHPSFKKEFNEGMLEKYLIFKCCVTNETFFKNVYKVDPGCYFFYKNGKLTTGRYYEFSFDIDDKLGSKSVVNDMNELIDDSITLQDINDNEGCILKNRIEDIYIAKRKNVSMSFNAFIDNRRNNNIFENNSCLKDTSSITKKISKKEYFDMYSMLQYYMDEPVSSYDLVLDYYNMLLMKDKTNVILSSEGFDLVFGCCNSYLDYYSNSWYNSCFSFLRRFIGSFSLLFKENKVSKFLIKYSNKLENSYVYGDDYYDSKDYKKILLNSSRRNVYKDVTKDYYDKVKKYSVVEKMQYIDYNFYLSNNLLARLDRMGSVNSINVRFPYIDRMIVNYSRRIPTKYKIDKKIKMDIFKSNDIMGKIENVKKNDIPMKEWLRERDTYDKIRSVFNEENSFFNKEQLNKVLLDHYENKKDNSMKIWTIYSFLVWYKEYFKDR